MNETEVMLRAFRDHLRENPQRRTISLELEPDTIAAPAIDTTPIAKSLDRFAEQSKNLPRPQVVMELTPLVKAVQVWTQTNIELIKRVEKFAEQPQSPIVVNTDAIANVIDQSQWHMEGIMAKIEERLAEIAILLAKPDKTKVVEFKGPLGEYVGKVKAE